MVGGNPARPIKRRFREELTALLLELRWWDMEPEILADFLPVLCNSDLETVEETIRGILELRKQTKNP